MTEEKYEDKVLNLLNQLVNQMKKSTESSNPPAPPETQSKTHEHSSSVVFDCPECQKEYDKKVLGKYREKLKGLKEPVICKECGEIVEREEEECPTCHGRKASAIER